MAGFDAVQPTQLMQLCAVQAAVAGQLDLQAGRWPSLDRPVLNPALIQTYSILKLNSCVANTSAPLAVHLYCIMAARTAA